MEAARPQLARILKAWCLIVEFLALPLSTFAIEIQLSASAKIDSSGSDLRQWDRWKAGQLPSKEEFRTLNNLAEKQGWMPEELGKLFVEVYVERSGTRPSDGAKSGWDQMILLSDCESFANSHKIDGLIFHCDAWRLAIDGPLDSDEVGINTWLAEGDAFADLNEQDDLKEEIIFYLERAIFLAFHAGNADPFPLVKTGLKELEKDWPDIKILLEDDAQSRRK